MQQTVYVDLYFMINFSMDFLCFFLTCHLLCVRLSVGRALLASALGGAYAVAALFMGVGGLGSLMLDILVCVVIAAVALAGIARLPSAAVVYAAVSMVLGGFMTALFSLFDTLSLGGEELRGDGIDAFAFALLALASALISFIFGKFFRRRVSRRRETVTVRVGERQARLLGLCDSGNLLRDPISSRLCVLADVEAVRDIVPAPVADAARRAGAAELSLLDDDAARRLRLIPTQTATGGGVLIALRVDAMLIGEGSEAKDVDALLALCPTGRFDGDCQALIPSELLM